jgi:hypothetical protein
MENFEPMGVEALGRELLAETAWRRIFASLDSRSEGGFSGDWLAEGLANEFAGAGTGLEGGHAA